ncbi:MAG: hypothetical protein U9N87_13660 [Planctomycetota bacterium]|nr:hypothetical protein [Planctomycetota bacterium]
MTGTRTCVAVCGAVVLAIAGCGRDGPSRYEVSGTVTYDGQSVPGGRILFAPDSARGNTGPGSVAEIRNGRYHTRREKGFTGGPCVVTIYGTDGSMPTEARDNALFAPYETHVDLPQDDCRQDFDVPRQPTARR